MATQAYAEITYGSRGLDLLESGLSPDDTIDRLTGDDQMRSHRQVGVVAADGRSASYTGEECFEHAGGVTGESFAAQGNILTNAEVPEAMASQFRDSRGGLAERLLGALMAGETAGGEKRGMESAALLVVRPGGGYGGNHDRWLDLRVDHSETPIEDLRGLLDLHTLYFGRTAEDELLPFDAGLRAELGQILDSIGWSDPGDSLGERIQSWLGWHNLEERWVGTERIDPVVLRELRSAAGGVASPE